LASSRVPQKLESSKWPNFSATTKFLIEKFLSQNNLVPGRRQNFFSAEIEK